MRRRTAPVLLVPVLLSACVSHPILAAGQDPPEQGAPQQDPEQWQPPSPNPKDFDWIKLTSLEWLKGDLEGLRDDQLEFDSDKLDTLTFDWSDVVELRSPRQNTIVVETLEAVTGTLLIRDDVVIVGTAEGERRFARGDLLSIIPGATASGARWSGKISIGAAIQSGNTNQTMTNSLISIKRSSPLSRITLTYVGNFGETDGTKNIDNQRFTGRWDLYTSERWFFTPLALDVYRDPFQNIEAQYVPSAGVGYHAIDESSAKWDVSLLGGWRFTRFDSVPAGGSGDESTAQITPGTTVEWDVTEKIEYFLTYSLEIGLPDSSDTNQHLVTGLSIDVWGDLDLDVTFQWDRIGNPEPDSSGIVPEKDDFRLTVGFGYSF